MSHKLWGLELTIPRHDRHSFKCTVIRYSSTEPKCHGNDVLFTNKKPYLSVVWTRGMKAWKEREFGERNEVWVKYRVSNDVWSIQWPARNAAADCVTQPLCDSSVRWRLYILVPLCRYYFLSVVKPRLLIKPTQSTELLVSQWCFHRTFPTGTIVESFSFCGLCYTESNYE